VRPSFIFATRLSASVADIHSLFEVFFLRVRSNRRTSSSLGSSIPSAFISRFTYVFQSSWVARRTSDFIAALASSVVESTAIVFPLRSLCDTATCSTNANTCQNTSDQCAGEGGGAGG